MRTVHVCAPASRVVRELSNRVNDMSVDAITLADTVFVFEPMPDGADYGKLMRHEQIHVIQNARCAPKWLRWMPLFVRARLGAPVQAKNYMAEWHTHGYWHNKYEIEARTAE